MENSNNRREFLKKAMYAAPTVMALGTLSAPAMANGSAGFKMAPVTTDFGGTQTTRDLEFPVNSEMGAFY